MSAETSTPTVAPTATEVPPVSETAVVWLSPTGKRSKVVSSLGKRNAPGPEAKSEVHEGIDLQINPGAPVKTTREGKVLFAGFSTAYVTRKDKNEKHRLVIVQHADGMSSRYVHLNSLAVRPMQLVPAGHTLGGAAESDEVSQPVLHFEIRDAAGKALDPLPFLGDAVMGGRRAP